MLLKTAWRLFSLLRQAILPRPFPGVARYLYRLAVLAIFLPLLVATQLIHSLGFLLDEVLFRGYRKVEIYAPVFVIGVPRSGTTFLHRLLASDSRYTTFSTWECLFAPSISQRYFWRGVGAVDRRIGRPLRRLLAWIERRAFAWMDDVHPVRLDSPEEDYLAFMPLLCCFILVVPFPEADWVWRMGRFDRDVPPRERDVLIGWYRLCLQKHLYFHGRDKTLLSKNASFAGMAGSLAMAFPDSRIVVCDRDSVQVVASQFNAVSDGLRLFGVAADDPRFRRRLLDCLAFYYENLARLTSATAPERWFRVSLWDLSRDTRSVIERLCRHFGTGMSPELEAAIAEYEQRRAPKTPQTVPDLASWGISPSEVRTRFAAWRHEEALRL